MGLVHVYFRSISIDLPHHTPCDKICALKREGREGELDEDDGRKEGQWLLKCVVDGTGSCLLQKSSKRCLYLYLRSASECQSGRDVRMMSTLGGNLGVVSRPIRTTVARQYLWKRDLFEYLL